jgi:hypothetical protein
MRREKKVPSSGSSIIWSFISVLMVAHKSMVIFFPVAGRQMQGRGFYKKHGARFNGQKKQALMIGRKQFFSADMACALYTGVKPA